MGFWRNVIYGTPPVESHDERPAIVSLHNPSSLEGMRVASSLQNGGWAEADFRSSAVFRGASLLADLAGQLPWYAYQGGDPALTGQRILEEPERLSVQPQLLLSPNVSVDRDDLIRSAVLSLVFHGDAFFYGSMMVDGRPTNVEVVNPAEVTVRPNAGNTRPIYEWRGNTMLAGVNFWHIMLNRRPGAWTGTGPLEAGRDIVAGVRAADSYARRLFTESGMPAGVLKYPGKLTAEEAKKAQDQWDAAHAGGRRTAVLSGGFEFEGISLTPEQSQFLATRAYGAQEVARLLGIPQWFLNAGTPPGTASALTYQNLNQVYVELTRNTLYPSYLRRLEKVFSQFLPRGQAVKFDLSEFLATDMESRYDAYKTGIEAGFLTVDEARAREGLPTGVSIERAESGESPNI